MILLTTKQDEIMIEIIYCMFGLALALLIIHELLETKNTRLKNKVWQARLERMKKDDQV